MKNVRQSLGMQVVLLVSITLALSFGLALYAIFHTLEKAYEELEARETLNHIERVAETATREIHVLSTRLTDWADWDDAYEYMKASNQRFEAANLVPEVLDSMQMDSVRFYTVQRVLQGKVDREGDFHSNSSAALDRLIPAQDLLWQEDAEHKQVSGLLREGPDLYIIAAQGIRPTSGEGSPLGRVFFIKKVGDDLPQSIQRLVKLPLKRVSNLNQAELRSDYVLPKERLIELPLLSSAHCQLKSSRDIDCQLTFVDLAKSPVLQLTFPLPRDLMVQGHQTIMNVAIAFAITIGLTLLVLLLGLDRLILQQISKLTKDVAALELSTATDKKVQVIGETEISTLAQQINHMLETIREQHQAIDNIIMNVHSGFVITDREGRITPSYTAHFQHLFPAVEKLVGRKLSDILFEHTSEREHFDSLYDQAMEQVLTEDLTLTQLPHLIERPNQWLRQECSGLYNAQQVMIGVLFTITDVTQQMEVEQQNTENKALLKILRSLNNFASFKESTRAGLEQWRNDLQIAQKQLQLRRFLHTLKGNFGIYGLQNLSLLIHHIEAQPLIGLRHLDEITETFGEFLDSNKDIIGMEYESVWRPQISFSREALLDLRLQAKQWKSGDEASHMTLAFIDTAIRQPFREGVKPLLEEAKRLAKRLHKNVEVQVVGGEVTLDLEGMRPIFEALIHPLRNAVDHGIEASEKRQMQGKSRAGLITLLARRTGAQSYCLELTDDGQGVDLRKLRAVVESSQSLGQGSQTLTDEQVLDMIFVDGISTAPVQTEISGRGLGMSVLKSVVERWGGKVRILSQAGLGCTVRIEWTER